MKYKMYKWQEETLVNWQKNNYHGIVDVVTGGGKTYLAMLAISFLQKEEVRVKIVVPTIALAIQWGKALEKYLNLVPSDYNYQYGTRTRKHDRPFAIYVINTARRKISLTILKEDAPVFLILDECHHYGSAENSRIFEFLPHFKKQYYSLGLSATPLCDNFDSVLKTNIGEIIYRYRFDQAKADQIIADSIIFLVGLHFNQKEQSEFEEETRTIAKLRSKILKEFDIKLDGNFMKELAKLSDEPLAIALQHAYNKRRTIIKLASDRLDCVKQLISQLSGHPKIIIFGERIEVANQLYLQLKEIYHNEVALYHSKVDPQMKKITLSKFQGKDIRILITCKALDEGLDVPDTDVGIVLSSSSVTRQKIQRYGRILRKSHQEKTSRLYYLYIKGTSDENNVIDGLIEISGDSTPLVRLDYKDDHFTNQEYMRLAKSILQQVKKELSAPQFEEFRWQIIKGIVNHDYLLSEEYLRQRISTSSDISERNYYIAILKLVEAKKK